MKVFKIRSEYSPTGDQPQAIEKLVAGVKANLKNQVLLGVTGSGKTFTMANIIEKLQMPALVISHNKTLAGQLYQEMRDFFPENAVSYYVSYYDYYQPEAYMPSTDTYIEKEAQINTLIDKMRLKATTNIMTRPDSIVVASVSCIYGIGNPKNFSRFVAPIHFGEKADWSALAMRLAELQYERSEFEFSRGTFRIRGGYMDVHPSYEDFAYRLYERNGVIDRIVEINPMTGEEGREIPASEKQISIFPAKQYLADKESFLKTESQIRADLAAEHKALKDAGKLLEAERLLRKVTYDLEMMKEIGYVNGIENYSRYFDGRKPGSPGWSLLDYFREAYGEDFLVFIDESHMTVPQIRGMFNGDQARKKTLIDFGFRLKAAFDNRPLKFEEFYEKPSHIIYASATPDPWEVTTSENEAGQKKFALHAGVVEQLIRPTGLVDPEVEIRSAKTEIPDLIKEIEIRAAKKEKVLVTTLTKKTAEELTEYLKEKGIRASYLHSDVDTLERSDVLDSLRKGEFDVLIGVNLLREGLDLPEVTLVAILDADKEGFLRSRTSLIQTMGRAARNALGKAILYADTITGSIKDSTEEIARRRELQMQYNKKHGITPRTIIKPLRGKIIDREAQSLYEKKEEEFTQNYLARLTPESMTPYDKTRAVKKLEREMRRAADEMHFELAIKIREKIKELKK